MIWIIGNKGMLGSELEQELVSIGSKVIGTDREVSILDEEALNDFALTNKPDWIINCSAYTAVDKAEDEPETAYALNSDGVSNIADVAEKYNIKLIHISTDYVFSGKSRVPLNESAGTGPVSVYGKSKLNGEMIIRERLKNYFILRTAWLYGEYGSNFVFTMLKLLNSKDSIKVVNDQHGSPTWTMVLSGLIVKIISSGSTEFGIYHISGEGQCTWYEFAEEIYRLGSEFELISNSCEIKPCTTAEYPTKALRPEYSLLSKDKVSSVFGYSVPDWRVSLNDFFISIKNKKGL